MRSASAQTEQQARLTVWIERGITLRHSRRCGIASGTECSCRPSYQAIVWASRARKPVRKSFDSVAEARRWRQTAQTDLRRNQLNVPGRATLGETAASWVEGARSGVIRTRSGEPYKPSALRGYEASLRRVIVPRMGRLRISAITRTQVQDMVDELVASGLAASTVANTLLPLRAIFHRAVEREEIALDPLAKVSVPKDRGRRERIAAPREIELLLAELPAHYRTLWSGAVYSGLRRGELQALRWENVDLERGLIRVEHSWDRVVGLVSPKSRAGERTVPIPAALAAELRSHHSRQPRGEGSFVFSIDGAKPFDPSNALRRAHGLWAKAGLRPLGFHECRHSYASLMIAAGVNAKALSQFMGHSSITVTLDRYGHLMPGSEREAADLLDLFLERDRERHEALKAAA